jgi:tetratricopeptide (TPR) repeat protein
MKPKLLITVLLLLSSNLLAQSAKTYLNSAGDKHLAGRFDLDVIKTDSIYTNWYHENEASFILSGNNIDWKKSLEDSEVEIFIGTWCGDSKRWVPQFVKLWNDLGLNEDQLKFTALYDGEELYKQGPKGEEKGKSIHRVPTFIFNKAGKEYARIVEFPVNDLETDLAQIALGYASEPNYRAATYLLELYESEPMDSIYQNIQMHFNMVYNLVGKEKELNTLGYVFQYSNQMAQALLTFELNAYLFPYSPNVVNSYAEALLVNGQTERAVEEFKRVLNLEPSFESAVNQLKKLEGEMEEVKKN